MSGNPTENNTTLKVICTRKDLSEGVQLVSHAVSERNPLPILTHVLIQSHEDGLLLSASDLELGISLTIPADVQRPGAATAPAKILSELLSSFPEGDITLTADRSHSVHLTVPGSAYRIAGLAAEEYPGLPKVDDTNAFRVHEKLLKEAIRQTVFCAATDMKARPVLSGVLLDFQESTLTLVATDTLRLAMRSIPVVEAKGGCQAVVPARALNDLQRALSDDDSVAEVRLSGNLAWFSTERGVTLTTRLIEGQYPQYRKAIPTTMRTRVTIPTLPLLQAVKRAQVMARHASDRLEFQAMEDSVVLTAESVSEGRAHETVEAIRDGDAIHLALNGRFMLEALSSMATEGIVMDFTDPTRPVVVRPKVDDETEAVGEYVCILMPLHLM